MNNIAIQLPNIPNLSSIIKKAKKEIDTQSYAETKLGDYSNGFGCNSRDKKPSIVGDQKKLEMDFNDYHKYIIESFIQKNNKKLDYKSIIEMYSDIKDLEDDWDGEGAKKISIETWDLAIQTFIEIYSNIPNDLFKTFEDPIIMPGFDGDIHISWVKESVIIALGIFQNSNIVFNINANGKNYGGDFDLKYFELLLKNYGN